MYDNLIYKIGTCYTQIPHLIVLFGLHYNYVRIGSQLVTKWLPSLSSWYNSHPRLMSLASQFWKKALLKSRWCNSIIFRNFSFICWNISLLVVPRSIYFLMSIVYEILPWAPNSCPGILYSNCTCLKNIVAVLYFFGSEKRWTASPFTGAVVFRFDTIWILKIGLP